MAPPVMIERVVAACTSAVEEPSPEATRALELISLRDLAVVVVDLDRTLSRESHDRWPSGEPAHAVFHPKKGWLVDLDMPESWSMRVADAMWFPSGSVAHESIAEAKHPAAKHRRYFVIRVN